VLRDDLADWFELHADRPYILDLGPVREHRCRPISAAERALFGIDGLNVPRSHVPV
jgi:carbamoyltransferase